MTANIRSRCLLHQNAVIELSGMNMTAGCASDYADAEKQFVNLDSAKMNSESAGRKYVNVLLDISEEDYCSENNMHLLTNRTGWEDAVEGWARRPSFAPFPQSQRKGKNKQDIIDSHCLLCADLKPSDLDAQTPLNPAKETHNALSSPSSDELCSFSLSSKNISGPQGDEPPTQKSPTLCHCQTEPCQIVKGKTVSLSIKNFSVLPPLKQSRTVIKTVQLTDEDTSAEDKMNTGNDIRDFIPGENNCKFKGALSTKLSQDNTQLPSTFNITFHKKYELPSSTLPQFNTSWGRNLKQEEFARPTTTRSNTGHRIFSSHKARELRIPEAHRLMLIGTRVHMPFVNNRLCCTRLNRY